jgi:hypothetical protein
MTADAKAIWVAYYNDHAREQADLSGDLAAAWSKLEEVAARLALVVHYSRWAAGDVADEYQLDAASMTAGITLANWFKGEARRVYAMFNESDADRTERQLSEWVERKGGCVTVRDVQQGCRWLKQPGAAEAALERLVAARRGSWRRPETTASGGRPTRVFVLSKPSTVHETPTTDTASGGSVDVDTVDAAEGQAASEPEPFPFGFNNPDDPNGDRLFPNPRGLPD